MRSSRRKWARSRAQNPQPDAEEIIQPEGFDPPPDANGAGQQEPRRIFEPPRGALLTAIDMHRALFAFCALAGCAIGLAIGLARQPEYTSSATLQVGQVNPNSPGFFGYVQSASGLATAFSRSIAAGPVLKSVEEETGLPRSEALPRLSSEPIPLSPAFRVIATGPNADDAMELANATAEAVVAYEGEANSSNPDARALLGEYKRASLQLHQAEAEVEEQESAAADDPGRLEAEAARSAAKVKQQAIENAYVAAVTSQAPRRGLVSMLATATSASSDRKAKIELWGLIGLLAGLAIGCAVAVMRERRLAPV
jgi:capsular polysaccharide biosynthesis protein